MVSCYLPSSATWNYIYRDTEESARAALKKLTDAGIDAKLFKLNR